MSSIDWARSASINNSEYPLMSLSGSTVSVSATIDEARDEVVLGSRNISQASIADQLSRWRGQSAHAAQASFSSIGSRSIDARSGGSQFDLDEQDIENEPLRSLGMLANSNRNGWIAPISGEGAARQPPQMRTFVLGGERPQTPSSR
jgi:hypothetical protein